MAARPATPAGRLIVALDVPQVKDARRLAAEIGPAAGVFKIGLELLYAGGAALAQELASEDHRIFVDAKLLDIPNTVERATANISKLGASFLTVHGTDSKTLEAAVKGRRGSDMKLLAITVLTSLDAADLVEQGITITPTDLVLRRARLAREAGFDGVVASGREASRLRATLGTDFLIVTPGIRPAGMAAGDQARVTTPLAAIVAGADYIVIGRPITGAKSPRKAAEAIVAEIEAALG